MRHGWHDEQGFPRTGLSAGPLPLPLPLPNVAGCRRILRVDGEESSQTIPTVLEELLTLPAVHGGRSNHAIG